MKQNESEAAGHHFAKSRWRRGSAQTEERDDEEREREYTDDQPQPSDRRIPQKARRPLLEIPDRAHLIQLVL